MGLHDYPFRLLYLSTLYQIGKLATSGRDDSLANLAMSSNLTCLYTPLVKSIVEGKLLK